MIVITLTIVLVTLLEGTVSEIDLRYVDDTVSPCDDFYEFACGNFRKFHQRSENQSTLEIFTMTEDELVEIGKDILSSPKRKDDPVALKKAKAAYQACINVVNVDNLVYYESPEKQVIKEFGGMPLVDNTLTTKVSWTKIGEIAGKFGIHQLFQFLVKNFTPDMYAVFMLPDSLDTPEMFRPRTVKSYDQVLEESFKKLSLPQSRMLKGEDPLDVFLYKTAKHLLDAYNVYKSTEELKKDLNDMKEFMSTLFAGGLIDDDMILPPDIATLGDLQNWTQQQFGDEADINWVEYFKGLFKGSSLDITEDFEVYIISPPSVYGTLNLVRKTDPRVVKNFILFRTFLYMAPDSDLPMREAFEEYYKSLGLQYYERQEYCARKILDVVDSASLSFAVAHDFVKYHFNINKIPEAVKLIKNLKDAFEDAVKSSDWIDDDSREAVIRKLNNIIVYLAYPDFVDDKSSLDEFYDNVRICEWDNYGNAQRIRAFKQAYSFSQYLNHDLWANSPFEVNAYAIRASNRIMAPIAMLQSSYFLGDNLIYDYSRFGSILAHEFIHHFDSSGTGFGPDGDSESLLSSNSSKVFAAKVQCFIDQYSDYYVPEVNSYINGSNTLDENMADNGGLRHALIALKKLLKDQLVKTNSEKYTTEQQFFIGYATTWCSDESYDYLSKIVNGNSHSPNHFRVIGTLSNMDEFSEAFSCPIGSQMNPAKKCVVW